MGNKNVAIAARHFKTLAVSSIAASAGISNYALTNPEPGVCYPKVSTFLIRIALGLEPPLALVIRKVNGRYQNYAVRAKLNLRAPA